MNDTVAGVNLRVQNLRKISTGFNSVESAIDFEALAGSSGYFKQTANVDLIIAEDSADLLVIYTVGGN